MILAAILGFISTSFAIVFCAVKANKTQDSWTSTDEDLIEDINEREAQKRAELLKNGGTIK